MNELISKFLHQCSSPSIDGDYNLDYVDQEKFAELIITECAKVCVNLQTPTNFTYKSSLEYAEAIKKHFKV
jgi:hypothetical protein